MKRALCAISLTTLAGFMAEPATAQGSPLGGPEFQVNTHTPLDQDQSAGVIADDGGFLIVWTSDTSPGSDDSQESIQGRYFGPLDPDGGTQFQINTSTEGRQAEPSVALRPDGTFVVVWSDNGSYPPAVRGQRLTADGAPLGGEFEVGNPTYGGISAPDVAASGADGEFVVAWSSGDGVAYTYLQAQRMTGAGAPVGPELAVAEAASLSDPKIVADTNGDALVVWSEFEPGDIALFAQRFDRAGNSVYGPVPLAPDAFQPDVALRPTGTSFVTWQGADGSLLGRSITGGSPLLGPVVPLRPADGLGRGAPVISMTTDGYAAAWSEGDAQSSDIQGQLLDLFGNLDGPGFRINRETAGFRAQPSISSNIGGVILFSWTADGGTDPQPPGIEARRFLGSTECTPNSSRLCLRGGRFGIEVRWSAPLGGGGPGVGVPLSDDSGYFWFLGRNNVELIVKVLEACNFNDHYWFFAAGLTNLEVELTVIDRASGEVRSYSNPQGMPFQPIQDTRAFMTCP